MNIFGVYRVLALVVGVLLAFCSFVAAPLKYLVTDGTSLQRLGEDLSILWSVHGFVFIVYVVVAFLLSRRASWTLQFTILALVAGLVPLLIFYVERVVAARVRDENPELAGT
ncbi:DUF3817 domain-containing protein [Nocardioides sp.]|uniref:DUF3817 domain-containing protein n=1 Tax=Nocardioides sp. TaxID=35761 RepID=UPI002716BD7B|nr:DUF3817 domain-containing protein [Nocardioides sp.]MDO9458231.1 DUF3817 domain-containing protein [Nocardioides sp.]